MSKNETLENALKEIMTHIRAISNLEQEIDERWGVTLRVSEIYPPVHNCGTGDIVVRRGLEAVSEALGEDMKESPYSAHTRLVKHYGIEYRQYADDRTKTFVKAWKQPPKVVIVEDDEHGS